MADQMDPNLGSRGEDDLLSPSKEGREAPRRAASAEFVVDAQVGSAAALRAAMDPANQSLTDALRLSYRVLQFVIVILLVLFLVSGVQTVEKIQSGVKLRFGAIQPVGPGGAEALEPGLHFSVWPFPAGEFVLLDVQNRSLDLSNTFWPHLGTQTLESAIEQASAGVALKPGGPARDGYLLVSGGDIAHLKLQVGYEIDKPEQFLRQFEIRQADAIVEMAVRRATVHAAAGAPLSEIEEVSGALKDSILAESQRLLDQIGAGIRVTQLNLPMAKAAFVLERVKGELQSTINQVQQNLAQVRQQTNEQLIAAAGPDYQALLDLIQEYEVALGEDDAKAEAVLVRINELIESPSAAGELVDDLIERARSHQNEIESTLGSEANLFAGLLEAYRRTPQLVVSQRWLAVYAGILQQPDAEVIYVPQDSGMVDLTLFGNEKIPRVRRDLALQRMERETFRRAQGLGHFIPKLGEIAAPGKAGSRLRVNEGSLVSPAGN